MVELDLHVIFNKGDQVDRSLRMPRYLLEGTKTLDNEGGHWQMDQYQEYFATKAAIRMEKLNRSWHLKHAMPPKATFEQRVKWHLEHVKHCACRPIPAKLLEQMREKGIKVP